MGRVKTVSALLLVMVAGFTLGYCLALIQASHLHYSYNPVKEYLQREYGVGSFEELRAKFLKQYFETYLPRVSTYLPWLREAGSLEAVPDFKGMYTRSLWTPFTQNAWVREEPPPSAKPRIVHIHAETSTLLVSTIMLSILLATYILREEGDGRRNRHLLLLALTVIAFSFYSIGYIAGSPPAPKYILHEYSGVAPYSYIIFGEDTDGDGVLDKIYAKNGRTGEIEFSGTDASYVLQLVINSLAEGEIFICAGTYEMTTPVELHSYITIVGEGRGTILNVTRDINLFKATSLTKHVVLANLMVIGNYVAKSAIYGAFQESKFSNLYIKGFRDYGIALLDPSGGGEREVYGNGKES